MTFTRFCLLIVVALLCSCFHLHISKVPKGYISSIKNNISDLSALILSTYKTNIIVEVDSVENPELKNKLKDLRVQYVEVTYRTDTTNFTSAQLEKFKRSTSDSLIVFGRSKNRMGFHIDNWGTDKEVGYYFANNKPKIENWKDVFSDLIKKVNDSIYFARYHFPPSR